MFDPTSIKTLSDARMACVRGDLCEVLMVPGALGGQPIPENTIYVTRHAADRLDATVTDVVALLSRGIVEYSVTPSYREESFVPATILIIATLPGAPEWVRKIEVW